MNLGHGGDPGVVIPDESLPHCATTFMGFTIDSAIGRAAVTAVLEPLVACGLEKVCRVVQDAILRMNVIQLPNYTQIVFNFCIMLIK